MSDITLTTTTDLSYDDAVMRAREALADQGFGVLTEIDIAATLQEKIGAEVAPQIILGACRPVLAHAAIQADPSVAAMLPCNVVVRDAGDHRVVEAFDPQAMITMSTDAPAALREVADDARERLLAALHSLSQDDA